MRRSVFFWRFFTLVLLSYSTLTLAQKKPDIKGNRTVTVIDKPLEAFHSIMVEEELDLSFKKGYTPLVHFVADENLPPVFDFSVKDSVLHISSYYRIKSKKELSIEVTYTDLKSLEVQGGTSLLDINSNEEPLELTVKNKSFVDIQGISNQLHLNLFDQSSVKLTSSLKSLVINAVDRTSVTVSGSYEKAHFKLANRSSLRAMGTVSDLLLDLSADSSFRGSALKTSNAQLNLSHNSVCEVYAIENVDLALKDNAVLNFYGTASLKVNEFSGSSQILKKVFNSIQD